jgi:hypothetical protein
MYKFFSHICKFFLIIFYVADYLYGKIQKNVIFPLKITCRSPKFVEKKPKFDEKKAKFDEKSRNLSKIKRKGRKVSPQSSQRLKIKTFAKPFASFAFKNLTKNLEEIIPRKICKGLKLKPLRPLRNSLRPLRLKLN